MGSGRPSSCSQCVLRELETWQQEGSALTHGTNEPQSHSCCLLTVESIVRISTLGLSRRAQLSTLGCFRMSVWESLPLLHVVIALLFLSFFRDHFSVMCCLHLGISLLLSQVALRAHLRSCHCNTQHVCSSPCCFDALACVLSLVLL